MVKLGLIDLCIFLIYFILGGVLVYLYSILTKSEIKKHILPGYFVKVLGALGFALIYIYKYEGGDTTFYFEVGQRLSKIAFNNPSNYFKLLFVDHGDIANANKLGFVYSNLVVENDMWTMTKLCSIFYFLGLGSYLGVTFFFSMISLVGSLYCVKIMNRLKFESNKIKFFIAFCIPGVLIWGSGLLKDTITLSCFLILSHHFLKAIEEKKISLSTIIISILLCIALYKIKFYILICFMLMVVIALMYQLLNHSTYKLIIRFLSPLILGVFFLVTAYSIDSILGSSIGEKDNALIDKVQGFHSWHTKLQGSSYDLNVTDYSTWGMIKKIPQSLNVTFFRPYLWEVSSPFILISSLESIAYLYLTVYYLVISRFRIIGYIKSSPFLIGALTYCLFFGFVIGFTSYNFGALTRFKIPLQQIYLIILLYGIREIKQKKEQSLL